MINQNVPTRLGAMTLIYLILKHAKIALRLVLLMIIITFCMNYWGKNMLAFFASHSVILHYFAVSAYAVLKYGWVLTSALFVCFGFAGFLEYNSTKFTLTNSSITVSTGTVTHKEIIIPFSQVETINISDNPTLRMFGLCTFVVKTSAQNGAGIAKDDAQPDAILPIIPFLLAKQMQNKILVIDSPSDTQPKEQPIS